MSRRSNLLVTFAVALLIMGAAGGICAIMSGSATSSSISSAVSYSTIGLAGQPMEYRVEHFSVEPYMGPYSFQWDYGDGMVEDGSNVTTHSFTKAGLYHPHVLVSGKGGWSSLVDLAQIAILANDSLKVTVLSMDRCDWDASHGGDLCLNLTIWNNAAFPLDLCKMSFNLHDPFGDLVFPIVNQTGHDIVRSGGNVTWTIFFPWSSSMPVSLSYFNLLEWAIDLKGS